MAPQAAQSGPTAPSGASLVAEPQNKGGRPRGFGKVPGSGRRKGVPNKLGREAREYLASHSDYLKTICALAKGKPIKFAARRGHKPTWHQPDWPDVKWALETIVNKLVPTVAQSEITGADGEPFMPEPVRRERTILETARAVGFLMHLADQDAGEPSPAPSVPKHGSAGAGRQGKRLAVHQGRHPRRQGDAGRPGVGLSPRQGRRAETCR